MKKYYLILVFLLLIIIFFRPFILQSLFPIPSDTIVGLYNPYRDLYATSSPRGVPFKNFLITDPVRQQVPWRKLVIESEKTFNLPLWNPYNFSGTPLLANFQSGAFYPMNILFLFLPFIYAWSFLIIVQPLLAGVFLYLYLKNLKLTSLSALLGATAFTFSGFSISWLEWGTIVQTIAWLPLLMLCIDKIINSSREKENSKTQSKTGYYIWYFIFIFSLVSAFFAGHLQTIFYLLILSSTYLIVRCWQLKPNKKNIVFFSLCYLLFFIITAIQWMPALEFISLSDRVGDQNYLNTSGWFIPWQNLIQFIVPDFFGNPSTLNYFGIWNYGELVGYLGIFPLIMALFSIFTRRDKKTFFFLSVTLVSLLFALPTPIASVPFLLHIPFISTAQPTRLLSIIDFSISILAALGFDYLTQKKKFPWTGSVIVGGIILSLWVFIFENHLMPIQLSSNDLLTIKRNLYLPTILFIIFIGLLSVFIFLHKRLSDKFMFSVLSLIFIFTSFDLLRFSDKFTPFTNSSYFFPQTKAITFLQNNLGYSRFMTTNSRIFPPNFSAMYNLESVDGYDPLYLKTYGQVIAASERGGPDIHEPFGFNRIITPHNINSPLINLLGVKYILSLSDITRKDMKKVFEEGDTKIYENLSVLPRAFFVDQIVHSSSPTEEINFLFNHSKDLQSKAVTSENVSYTNISQGVVNITTYSSNKISIMTTNAQNGFLVLTDTYYPTWHVAIDAKQSHIFKTDLAFRGVFVPAGRHVVTFYDTLF